MEFKFNNKLAFMQKLEELLESGIPPKKMRIYLPHQDHEIEHLIEKYSKPSKLKYFTLIGGITGCLTGFAFTSFTALDWELRTGAKPYLSWPAYVVIAFELTILFAALSSFVGIMILGRLPKFSKMLKREDYQNLFVIIIENED